MDRERLIQRLQWQLDFIARSVQAMDDGCSHEALRIATALRVLFHGKVKGSNGPVLKHLGCGDILLHSTCNALTPGAPRPFATDIGIPGRRLPFRMLADFPFTAVPLDEWWTQVVCIRGALEVTRADLILNAAEKDGGAHVDLTTKEIYDLPNVGWSRVVRAGDGVETEQQVELYQFDYLYRFGCEVLYSEALLDLADVTVHDEQDTP